MPERLAAAEHRAAQIDRKRVVPLLEVHAVEAECANADADIENHAVEPAETIDRLVDHSVHIGFTRDVSLDREGPAALACNALDRVIGTGAVDVGNRDMGALPLANSSDMARPLPTGSVAASNVRCPPPTTRILRP